MRKRMSFIPPLSFIRYPFVQFVDKVICRHINGSRSDSHIAICQCPVVVLLVFGFMVSKFTRQPEIIRVGQTGTSSPFIPPMPFSLFTDLYSFYISCIRKVHIKTSQSGKSFFQYHRGNTADVRAGCVKISILLMGAQT